MVSSFPQKSFKHRAELKDFNRNACMATVLAFHCYVRNCNELSGLIQHVFIILQFSGSGVWPGIAGFSAHGLIRLHSTCG